MTERAYKADDTICHKGDRLDYWTGVAHGLVKISAISSSGKAMTFAGIGPGGWFGEGSVLKKEPRKYDLVALRDTRLIMMSQATFEWLFEHSVAFNRFLVRQLNERMGQFIATIEHDRMLGPAARVARHIAWLCNPVLYPRSGPTIEISQEELALLAGVSRQSVNKCLQEIEAAGLVKVERTGVTVLDVGGLFRFGD
ncbi:MAG TPA: Crp/Fnr family transcriptional regulator [Hyphomicrobiaceae bacterium]|nr:Crp/Fnr family transcriptional regulator [Hyphomicrobiaceae bacterium]